MNCIAIESGGRPASPLRAPGTATTTVRPTNEKTTVSIPPGWSVSGRARRWTNGAIRIDIPRGPQAGTYLIDDHGVNELLVMGNEAIVSAYSPTTNETRAIGYATWDFPSQMIMLDVSEATERGRYRIPGRMITNAYLGGARAPVDVVSPARWCP